MSNTDPRCPECGGKIGQSATYCMHCSADLTDERGTTEEEHAENDPGDLIGSVTPGDVAGEDDPGHSPAENTTTTTSSTTDSPTDATTNTTSADVGTSDQVLDPDGLVDNTLTVIVGIVGGIVVGLVGTMVLLALTGSGWGAAFGFLAWIASTAHLVRRRTVQGAISRSAYAVAIVLLLIPLVMFSPLVNDSNLAERGGAFVGILVFIAFPAGFAALIGYIAGKFVPEEVPNK